MKYFSRKFLLMLALAIVVCTPRVFADDATFKIELIPTVVWQGQTIHSAMVRQVDEFHRAFPKLKIVHAVNPRLLMNGAKDIAKIQQYFGVMLNEEDGIAMHVSRLREWMVFSRLTPTSGENLYGIVSDSCDELCGMDQSFAGIGNRDFAAMIATGMTEMNRAGFGTPRIVIVEQGTLPETQWDVLAGSGFKADWSGFNMDIVADRLKGFPIYAMNEQARTSLAAIKSDAAVTRGRSLDHMRFGVWLEAADLGKIDAATDAAIAMAKSSGRVVKVPLLVNASTIVHSGALMTGGVSRVFEKVGNAHGLVVAWSGDDNSNWDGKKLNALAGKGTLANSAPYEQVQSTQNPEVVLNADAQAKQDPKSATADSADVAPQKQALVGGDDKPADNLPVQVEDPQVIPSHSREMSH